MFPFLLFYSLFLLFSVFPFLFPFTFLPCPIYLPFSLLFLYSYLHLLCFLSLLISVYPHFLSLSLLHVYFSLLYIFLPLLSLFLLSPLLHRFPLIYSFTSHSSFSQPQIKASKQGVDTPKLRDSAREAEMIQLKMTRKVM